MNEVLLCLVTVDSVIAAARFPIGQRTMPIVNDSRHLLENLNNLTRTQHVREAEERGRQSVRLLVSETNGSYMRQLCSGFIATTERVSLV